MRLRRRLLSIVGLVCFLVSASLPISRTAWSQAGGKSIFNFRLTGDPETLDWNRAHTAMETFLLMNLMDGLVAFDSRLKVVPALAKSWTRSEDGKTYTFKLREDVKWEDGVGLTAKDFVYSWRRLLSPLTAASYAYLLFDIEGAESFNKGALRDFNQVGVKAPDDFTFQVKLTRPVAHWIQIPTFWVTFPLREDVVQKHGGAWARPGRMKTLGPFTLASYELDSKVVLKANPNYYGGKVAIDEAVGRIVVDDATALRMFEAGQLDFLTEISGFDISRLKNTPEFKGFPYLKTQYLGLGNELFPTDSVKFRRAIAMAIDKRKFPPVLMGGQKEAASFVPPGMLGHAPRLGLPFDPIAARKELAASGILNRAPLKILSRNNDKAKAVAEIVQSELKKNLGLDIKVELFDHKAYRAQMDLFTYPLFEATWGADYPDPDNFLALFKTRSGNNRPRFKSAHYDEQIDAAKGLGTDAPREKIYLALQKELIEEKAALVPLYYDTNVALVGKHVQGIELNPLNYLELRRLKLGAKK